MDLLKEQISTRSKKSEFVSKGKDFLPFLEESTGGRPSQDYIMTLDMAKEIAMIQRSDKGKQAREYFIACEKQLKQVPQQIAETKLPSQIAETEMQSMANYKTACINEPKCIVVLRRYKIIHHLYYLI